MRRARRLHLMQKLKWFAVGVALTCWFGDWVRLRAERLQMDTNSTLAVLQATRSQSNETSCLVELAVNRSLIESWTEKTKLATLAREEALQMVKRAEEGDPNAIFSLRELGFYVTKPSNRLMAFAGHPSKGSGM